METKYFLLGLLIVVLFVSGCCCCAPPTEKTSVSKPKTTTTTLEIVTGTQIKLVKEIFAGRNPSLYGNYLVYDYNGCLDRLDFQCKGNQDIYIYDISKNKTERITVDPLEQQNPWTDGTWIIWEDYRFFKGYMYNQIQYSPDIFLYDMKTGEETKLSLNLVKPYKILNFIDGRILYLSNQSVYYYDVVNEKTTKPYWNNGVGCTSINNNRVVYTQGNPTNIFLFDIELNQTTQITDEPYDQIMPGIHGNTIVWIDYRQGYGNSEIYLYDLNTKAEKSITNTPDAGEGSPRVYGDYIVFSRGNVILYNILTGEETIVYTQEYSHGNTEILDFHENKILIQTQTAPLTHETLYLFSFTS